LALYDFHPEWDEVHLVSWLDHNIPDITILPDEKAAFLDRAVSWLLQERSLPLADLL
jgi:hypothetical protein